MEVITTVLEGVLASMSPLRVAVLGILSALVVIGIAFLVARRLK